MSNKPATSPEAILVQTRFSFRRTSLHSLLLRVGVRGMIILIVLVGLLALFAVWAALHPGAPFPVGYHYGGPSLP